MGYYDPSDRRYKRGKRKKRKRANRELEALKKRILERPRLPIDHIETQMIHGQPVTVRVVKTGCCEGFQTQTKPWRRLTNLGRSNSSNVVTRNEKRELQNRVEQRDDRAVSVTSPKEAQHKADFILRRKAKIGHVGTRSA